MKNLNDSGVLGSYKTPLPASDLKIYELDNGTTACTRHSLICLQNLNHKIRQRCPSCRQEPVIDIKNKFMTCENKKCRYFNKPISSIVKRRKEKAHNEK